MSLCKTLLDFEPDTANFGKSSMDARKKICENYAKNTAFLWEQRSLSITEPHYTLRDIVELERRIEVHLDGLMASLDTAWQVCEPALDLNQPGDVFTATVLAFRSGDVGKIKKALTVGLTNHETFRGTVSALGWLPKKICHPWIVNFLHSNDNNHKYLAISACSVRRINPADRLTMLLQREDCLAHEKLHARILRLIGELRRHDLMPTLDTAMSSENADITFWANWSALLLGKKAAAYHLQPYISNRGPYQDIAIQLVFRLIPIGLARNWISEMAKNPDQIRAVVKATGVLGDPHAVSWLIGLMKDPRLARIAGESFTNITGIDLQEQELTRQISEVDDEMPAYVSMDRTIIMDEDESLPWPDNKKVEQFWQQQARNFVTGQRYFLGREISADFLQQKLTHGYQRQRQSAALELAIINPDRQLVNIYQRARANR